MDWHGLIRRSVGRLPTAGFSCPRDFSQQSFVTAYKIGCTLQHFAITEPPYPSQSALPDHQHPPARDPKCSDRGSVAGDISVDLSPPEFGAGRRRLAEVTAVS